MKPLFIALSVLLFVGVNKTIAQPDSTNVSMNTSMAFNPSGNASLANISMWPNPAMNSVNIYINSIRPGDRGEVTMFNTNGIRYAANTLSNGINKIYFGALPEGIYFLNISLHNDIVFSKKLVVRR